MGSCLGFHSYAEFNAYVTFVLLGMSIMMVPSAITSAPGFITTYYSYATGKPNVKCEKPYFWNNANTFYNAGTYVMQVLMELFCLTPVMRRIPLSIRLYAGLIIPFFEMLLFIIVPAAKVPTQDGAIAVLMVVSVMGGFSKALVDSTTNALVGPFPTKFMNGEQWGLTVIALLMSIIQIILKAAMGMSFTDVLNQSRIYFGIGIGIQVVSLVMMALLHRNPYAQKYVAEFRVKAAAKEGGMAVPVELSNELAENQPHERELSDTGDGIEPYTNSRRRSTADGVIRDEELAQIDTLEMKNKALDQDDADDRVRAVEDQGVYAGEDTPRAAGNAAVLRASGDADKMQDLDQVAGISSSEQMLRVSVLTVFKKVWPMLLCAFIIFFTSLFLFPGLFFRVDETSEWFSTIIVTLFNAGDFVSRIILMFRPLRPAPMVVVGGTFGRLIVVPLLVLCVRDIIHGQWMPYILVTVLGITNGYFGTMACIHCPRTPTLRRAGERSLAAMLSGVALMLGLCAGSNFALLLNLTI